MAQITEMKKELDYLKTILELMKEIEKLKKYNEELIKEMGEDEDEEWGTKCCCDCGNKCYWDDGYWMDNQNNRAEIIEYNRIVCSLCYKGQEENFPSDDEDED